MSLVACSHPAAAGHLQQERDRGREDPKSLEGHRPPKLQPSRKSRRTGLRFCAATGEPHCSLRTNSTWKNVYLQNIVARYLLGLSVLGQLILG